MWHRIWRAVGAGLALLCIVSSGGKATDGPVPPCGAPEIPATPDVGAPAAVKIWRADDLPGRWTPPVCVGWKGRGFAALIAVSGRMAGIENQQQLLRRLTATSAMSEIRYWSYTRKQWRRLFTEVVALDGPDPERRRADMSVEDIRQGRDYFLWQKENSFASGMVFRNRAFEISENRLVLQQENVSASRIAFMEIFGPGEFETVAFLEREQGSLWRYYSLSRIGGAGDPVTQAELASLVNRLVAGYRYLAGIPTDREPPPAP